MQDCVLCLVKHRTRLTSPSLIDGNLVPRVSPLHILGKRRDPGNKVGSTDDDDDDDNNEYLS